jgi:hypothetical protein
MELPIRITGRMLFARAIGLQKRKSFGVIRNARMLGAVIALLPLFSGAQVIGWNPPTTSTLVIGTCFETVSGLGTDCRVPSPGVQMPEGPAIVVDESPVGPRGSAELFLNWGWQYSPANINFVVENDVGLLASGTGGRAEYLPILNLQGTYVIPPGWGIYMRPITFVGNVSDGGAVLFQITHSTTLGFCGSSTLTASYSSTTPGPFSVTIPAQIRRFECPPVLVGNLSNYRTGVGIISRVSPGTSGGTSWIKLAEPIFFGTADSVADIEISPAEVSFGDVEVGDSRSAMVTISNAGLVDLTVSDISLQSGADYAITSSPGLPLVLPVGGFADVTVTFTPLSSGARPTDFLEIVSNDPIDGLVSVPLNGVGVVLDVPPSEQIANILTVIEDGVGAGTIIPDGPGQSGGGRLGAFINMLEAADDLIADGQIAEACQQLLDAVQRADGLSGRGNPPDFISGPDAALVTSLIQDLRTDLGCL